MTEPVTAGGLQALSVGANDIERLEKAIVIGGAVFVVVSLVLCAYFVFRYRKGSDAAHEPAAESSSTPILGAATAAVIALVGLAFHSGLVEYVNDTIAPADSFEVAAQDTGTDWAFNYPNGASGDATLRLPVGRPINFTVSSQDSTMFIVPELRLRTRVHPGEVSTAFIQGDAAGTAHILDTKGQPRSDISFIPADEFDEYMRVGPSNPYCTSQDACTAELSARWGEDLFAQNACIGCHSRDGSRLVGPSFKNVYGRDETMTTGLVVHIDDAYIRESIRYPQAKIVKGFQNVAMPSFLLLPDRKVDALIAYLKTIH